MSKQCTHENIDFVDADVLFECQCGAGQTVEKYECVDCGAKGTAEVEYIPCKCNMNIEWEPASE
jgi:hypothetical protein